MSRIEMNEDSTGEKLQLDIFVPDEAMLSY
jgi:hypothetical protein